MEGDVFSDRRSRLQELSNKLKTSNPEAISKSSPICQLCSSKHAVVQRINKAWVKKPENVTIETFIRQWNKEYKKIVGEPLTKEKVEFHFEHHFNASDSAVKKYEILSGRTDEGETERETKLSTMNPHLVSIYNLLEDKYLNELKVLDFTIKQQLEHLKELKEIKIERKAQGINFGIENLIMKEEDIIRSVQATALNKIKTFQTGKLQQAQTKMIDSINTANSEIVNLLGLDPNSSISPKLIKQSQTLFVSTVIKNLLERISKTLDKIGLSNEKKALFYNDLKDRLNGIEDEIFKEFEKNVKTEVVVDAEVVE